MKKVNKQLGMLQRAGAEKLGRAEKSVEELPEHIAIVQRHHEVTRSSCERVQKKMSNNFQSTGSEYEKRVRKLPQTALANCLHEASSELGTTPLALILDLCGDVTQRIAMQTACWELMVEQSVISPLSHYLDHDASALEKLFKKLQKSRLEMDSAASRVHKMEKSAPVAEADEKRMRFEMESTESKFHSLQSAYVTDLLEVASKEHSMASNFVSMMEDQVRYHEECISRLNQTVPRMREVIDHTPFRPSFSIDLATHCAVNGKPVSMVIENCCAALMPHIDVEEGLFRLAGPVSQVKKLKAHIDYGILDFSDCSPHTTAGVLKLYLRELPDPLFTEERYEEWKKLSLMGDAQHTEKMQLLYQYLHGLPEVNYANIRYLMVFLNRMAQHQDTTKMGASNLALVIGPNLFVSSANADGHMQDTGPLCTLVEIIITHAEYFFPEGDESMDMAITPTSGSVTALHSAQTSTSEYPSSAGDVPPSSKPTMMKAQEGFHKASQGGREKASNGSGGMSGAPHHGGGGRSRVLSSASSAASAASSAVSGIRSKLMPKDKDKDRTEQQPPPSRRPTPATSPPTQQPPPSRRPTPATSPPTRISLSSPQSSSSSFFPPSSSLSPSSGLHPARPLVPPPNQPHPSSRNVTPTPPCTTPPPMSGPSPPPKPPPTSSSRQSSPAGSLAPLPRTTASGSSPGATPARPATRPIVPSRNRTTTA